MFHRRLYVLSVALALCSAAGCSAETGPGREPTIDGRADAGTARRADADARTTPDTASHGEATDRLLERFEGTCRSEPVGESGDAFARRYRFDVTLPETEGGVAFVPFVQTGRVRPLELETPTGETLDLRDDYRHHNYRLSKGFERSRAPSEVREAGAIPFEWTFVLPYAPRFAPRVQPGESYELTVAADRDTSPCLYVVGARPGREIDVNLHLVGLGDFDADDVPEAEPIRTMLDRVDALFAAAGVELGEVRGIDVSPSVARRYAILRDDSDVAALTARSGGATGERSIDVFVVRDILKGHGDYSTLGATPSLPGPPGMHGQPRSGLVLRGSDLQRHPDFLGYVLAHELGHYLGLRHTTERLHGTSRGERLDDALGTTDPIRDTPVCESIAEGDLEACPDADNLMFPLAPRPESGAPTVDLTEGQGHTLRVHPLVD
jgi:hypothetical protein